MHLSTILLGASTLIAATNAWWIEVIEISDNTRGAFHYDSGNIYIDRDFNDGCAQRNLPGVVTLCMDWRNRRGHFIQDDGTKNYKFCFRQGYHQWVRGPQPDEQKGGIWYGRWEKADCSWGRLAEGSDNSTAVADSNALLIEPSTPGAEFQPFETGSETN